MTSLIMLAGDPAAQVGGYTISGVGYIIVFGALIILVVIFIFIPKVIQHFISLELKKNNLTAKKESIQPAEAVKDANINVAIAMGLHMYFNELHDSESNVITIRNAQKQYSPWSSKIYGVMNQPTKSKW